MAYYRNGLIATMVLFLILDGAAMAARLFVRLRIKRSFGADDVMLSVSYLGYIIMCGIGFAAFYYGFAAEDDNEYSTAELWYNTDKAKHYYFANQLTIYISSGLVKLAVALVLLRLTSTKAQRWLLIGSMVVVVIWTVVMTVFASFLCAKAGSSNYAGSATCNFVGYFRTTTNIIIDYFYALLPIYILWNVKMSWRLKLSAIFLLGLGILASASTLVKLAVIIKLNHATGTAVDPLHYQLLLWADIELGLAILAASLAAVRPLLIQWNIWKGSTNRSTKRNTSATDASGPYHQVHVFSRSGRAESGGGGVSGSQHAIIDDDYEMTSQIGGEPKAITRSDGGSSTGEVFHDRERFGELTD